MSMSLQKEISRQLLQIENIMYCCRDVLICLEATLTDLEALRRKNADLTAEYLSLRYSERETDLTLEYDQVREMQEEMRANPNPKGKWLMYRGQGSGEKNVNQPRSLEKGREAGEGELEEGMEKPVTCPYYDHSTRSCSRHGDDCPVAHCVEEQP